MMDKKYLVSLVFDWDEDRHDDDDDVEEEEGDVDEDSHNFVDLHFVDILGKLQPTTNLERLDIVRYMGMIFPEWVGDPSYNNLTELCLSKCKKCCIFPPIGQLPSLKKLVVDRMDMLRTIGCPYGTGTLFFPSLESLEFNNMSCWEKWYHPQESNDYFPVLKSLVIHYCPKLQGLLPTCLPAVETIEIMLCSLLASSLPRAPAIRKLEIVCSSKVSLCELPLSLSLQELRIVREFGYSEEKTDDIIALPPSMRALKIENCEKLSRSMSLTSMGMLTSLEIKGPCSGVESFPIEGSPLLLPSLTCLLIGDMSSLQTLECTGLLHLTSLQRLKFVDCPKLENMEGERLPVSLIKLEISCCPPLKERCLTKHPQIWPKISHIRDIELDCIKISDIPDFNVEW
jgi:hypothetical protein